MGPHIHDIILSNVKKASTQNWLILHDITGKQLEMKIQAPKILTKNKRNQKSISNHQPKTMTIVFNCPHEYAVSMTMVTQTEHSSSYQNYIKIHGGWSPVYDFGQVCLQMDQESDHAILQAS